MLLREMLTIGAGLLFRTMLALHDADFGYPTEGILVTYATVTAIVLPVIMLAAALPAWRASAVDPRIALRNE